MTPDGYDDVRVLLRELDPGPLPPLDIDAIMRGGELERRRRARSRWYAVAAVLVLVAAIGAGLLTLAKPQAVGPAAPGGSSTPAPGTSSFRPVPQSPDQWLLYAQPAIDTASSVHLREQLAPGQSTASVDVVLGPSSADGTVTFDGVTSRYLAVDGTTYVEPAVLVQLGLIAVPPEGTARWIKLGPPDRSRLRLPASSRDAVDVADASRWAPRYGTPRTVDGVPTTAIATNVDGILANGQVQVFYLTTASPHLPLLIELDGKEIASLRDWNAPIAPPVAPPASEVTTVPGL